jgi:phage tail sheath protein FI
LWSEQAAQHDAAKRIDSIKTTLAETPMCLENLRMELERFVALYGAPIDIKNAVDSCSDGTIRPSEEYAKFLKMQEEWEANKPALDAECKKVYEDKMKEIQERINKCLNGD